MAHCLKFGEKNLGTKTALFKFGSLLDISFKITIFMNFCCRVRKEFSSKPEFSSSSKNLYQGG